VIKSISDYYRSFFLHSHSFIILGNQQPFELNFVKHKNPYVLSLDNVKLRVFFWFNNGMSAQFTIWRLFGWLENKNQTKVKEKTEIDKKCWAWWSNGEETVDRYTCAEHWHRFRRRRDINRTIRWATFRSESGFTASSIQQSASLLQLGYIGRFGQCDQLVKWKPLLSRTETESK